MVKFDSLASHNLKLNARKKSNKQMAFYPLNMSNFDNSGQSDITVAINFEATDCHIFWGQ